MTIMNRTADAWRSTQARPTMPRMLGASALAVAIAGFTQAAAAATDTKDYSGAACVSEGQQAATFLIDRQGGLFNGGAERRDRPLPGGAGPEADQQCPGAAEGERPRDRLRPGDGQQQRRASRTSSSCPRPSAAGQAAINFASQLAPSTGVGTYSLQCTLPPASRPGAAGILMYRIVESD